MAKGTRGHCRIGSRQFRQTPYPLPHNHEVSEEMLTKKCFKVKKDWEDATCSVCMEYPHNAVLLLCSSHDKGCRPYMCGTSLRYSNCLDQYKKAYTKIKSMLHDQPSQGPTDSTIVGSVSDGPLEKCEVSELACPLCRGPVKGWTIVEPAREFLNAKKRSCMEENCLFVGAFKELRKHVKKEHPCARPRDVDPTVEQRWRRFEREREQEDVISTIRSTMPGAMVFGDYVIEGGHYSFDTNDDLLDDDVIDRNEPFEVEIDSNLVNVLFLLHALGPTGNAGQSRGTRRHERDLEHVLDEAAVGIRHTSPIGDLDSLDQNIDGDRGVGDNGGMSFVNRLPHRGGVVLGCSRRRRRRRQTNGGSRGHR